MTDDRRRTRPTDDALEEPTEGHVDVDAATAAHRGEPNAPLAGIGGTPGQRPDGILAGAGLTDHDQPAEGGREEAEDGGVDAEERGTGRPSPGGQTDEGTSF